MSRLRVCLTHDVDRVHKTYQYVTHDVRQLRLDRLRTLVTGERPYWTFETIMRMEDRYGARSTFYFLEESIAPRLTSPKSWMLAFGRYRFSERRVAEMIRTLDKHGWEVGLHGSYNSYRSADLLRREKESLEAVLGHQVIGIRQHYLNLDIPRTWELQRSVGLRYDASFGLLGAVGYREERRDCFRDPVSGMVVIPLAIMECYLFSSSGHDRERAWIRALELIDEAEQHEGVLSLLWHPHMYYDDQFPGYTDVYERVMRECAARGARFMTGYELYEEYERSSNG